MNYRKKKKVLTKLLREAISIQDEHPLSGSASRQVLYIANKLINLRNAKNENK